MSGASRSGFPASLPRCIWRRNPCISTHCRWARGRGFAVPTPAAALVIPAGVVSIDVGQYHMTTPARTLFGLNLLPYAVLLVMRALRLRYFPRELLADFVSTGQTLGARGLSSHPSVSP